MLIKSALKGSNQSIVHEAVIPLSFSETADSIEDDDSDAPIIASDHSESEVFDDKKSLSQYTHVSEAKPLDADIYKVTKKKSRHKVRHDVYNLDVKVFDILRAYAKQNMYPPKEVLLHLSRIYQYEHVNEHLAELKVQESSSHVIADGPKGGVYKLSSKTGKKKYL